MATCKICRGPLKPLLFSTYCPACEGGRQRFPGWVVYRDDTFPFRAYVFQARAHAEDWARIRIGGRVLEVESFQPLQWRTGVQSTAHLVFHHVLATVYAAEGYELGADKVHLKGGK